MVKQSYDILNKRISELEKENLKLKKEKQELLEKEENLRLIVENQNDLIVRIDNEYNLSFVSPNYCSTFGKTEKELIGKKFFPFIHKDDLKKVKKSLEKLCKEPYTCYHEERAKTIKGWRWFAWSNKAVLDGKKNVKGIIAVGRDISDQKSTEEALKESEERHRGIIDASPDAISYAHIDGTILYSSKNGLKMYGYDNESDVIGKKFFDFIIPEQHVKAVENYQILIKQGFHNPFEYTFVRKDGSHFPGELSAVVIKDEKGNPQNLVAIIRDISERKQTEKALQESEESLKIITGLSTDYFYSAFIKPDGEMKIDWISGTFKEITGYSVDDIKTGSDWMSRIHPEDIGTIESAYKDILNNKSIEQQYRIYDKKGEIKWLFDTSQPVWDKNEKRVVRIFGAVRDITNQKNAEIAILEEKEKAQNYLDIAEVMLVALDKNCNITLINKKGCKILGYDYEQIINKNWIDNFVPEADRKSVLKIFKSILEGVEDSYSEGENYIINSLGEKRLISWHNIVIKDKTGVVTGTISSGEDITDRKNAEIERKRLEEQLLHSQKMESIGRLAGGVAHDFNNILGSIMGYSEMLRMKYPDTESNEGKAANVIMRNAERAANLTKQLLGFARGGKYNPVPVKLNEIINESVHMSEKIFEKNIDVIMELDKNLKNVEADKNQMSQVFTNLIINARDAMPGGGKLKFKSENVVIGEELISEYPELKEGKYVKISVADTGMGMPKEIKDNIFEPFFTTKGNGKGTGLGLATVYGIVKNHRGYIYCDSEPGEGTAFSLYFPVSGKRVIDKNEEEKIVRGNETILVVDDEEGIRGAAKLILENLGYKIILAKNGFEAVEIYKDRETEISLVLLDMVMPKLAGKETYIRLKKINPDIKVILSSGYSQDDKAMEIVKEGVLDFIQKPFRVKELSKIVYNALKK